MVSVFSLLLPVIAPSHNYLHRIVLEHEFSVGSQSPPRPSADTAQNLPVRGSRGRISWAPVSVDQVFDACGMVRVLTENLILCRRCQYALTRRASQPHLVGICHPRIGIRIRTGTRELFPELALIAPKGSVRPMLYVENPNLEYNNATFYSIL
jgi:hypothetical protein